MDAAAVRVKRGARWLDENFPGWEKRIDTTTLDLANGETCICGQVFKKRQRNTKQVVAVMTLRRTPSSRRPTSGLTAS